MMAGQNAADIPFEIRTGYAPEVLVTLTGRSAEIYVTLFDGTGKPTPDYFVVVFSTDRDQWAAGSRRVRAPARPSSDGKFRLPLLPPGTYYVAAVSDVEAEDMADRAFLEQIAAGALTM